uniref:H15 domain-containing protein n=1 Tax=Glossina pallidipes TaxID=7398 RepID=A0A1B0AFP2_GLOPL
MQELVDRAILKLKEKDGSSVPAMKKAIMVKYPEMNEKRLLTQINAAANERKKISATRRVGKVKKAEEDKVQRKRKTKRLGEKNSNSNSNFLNNSSNCKSGSWCGTGILSMFAAKSGAATVIAVDCSNIVEYARQVVFDNNLHDIIKVVKRKIEGIE